MLGRILVLVKAKSKPLLQALVHKIQGNIALPITRVCRVFLFYSVDIKFGGSKYLSKLSQINLKYIPKFKLISFIQE